jgi:hypothetical protein
MHAIHHRCAGLGGQRLFYREWSVAGRPSASARRADVRLTGGLMTTDVKRGD